MSLRLPTGEGEASRKGCLERGMFYIFATKLTNFLSFGHKTDNNTNCLMRTTKIQRKRMLREKEMPGRVGVVVCVTVCVV